MSRLRRFWVLVAVVVLLVATLAFLRRGSDTADERILPREQFVGSYRIVYAVEEYDSPARTEERIVERPYLSKVISRRDGSPLSGSITNREGRWMLLRDQGTWQLLVSGRRPADDTRPLDALEAAVGDGRVVAKGSDSVLGRRCTVVRVGGLPGGALERPTSEDFTDLCIDRTGVVLRERWMVDGKQARLMVATTFTPEANLDEGDFDATPEGPPLPDDVIGLERVRNLAAGEPLPVKVRGVAGYRADGAPVALERQVPGRGLDVTYQQMFVKAGRLVVAEQGLVTSGFRPRGYRVDLGGGIVGRLDLGLSASTLNIDTGRGTYVRFRGADLAVLEAFGADVAERLG